MLNSCLTLQDFIPKCFELFGKAEVGRDLLLHCVCVCIYVHLRYLNVRKNYTQIKQNVNGLILQYFRTDQYLLIIMIHFNFHAKKDKHSVFPKSFEMHCNKNSDNLTDMEM